MTLSYMLIRKCLLVNLLARMALHSFISSPFPPSAFVCLISDQPKLELSSGLSGSARVDYAPEPMTERNTHDLGELWG